MGLGLCYYGGVMEDETDEEMEERYRNERAAWRKEAAEAQANEDD